MKPYFTFARTTLLTLGIFLTTLAAFGQYCNCSGFSTYTQGGWSSTPQGNNPGTILESNFNAAFPAPTYLTVGCTNKLTLTSAAAVRAYLPQNATPGALPNGTRVNPLRGSLRNVFAGQMIALTINLRMDQMLPNFGPNPFPLADLRIAYGPFAGLTVQQFFDMANQKLGGCTPSVNASFSAYNNAADLINNNYNNGSVSGNFLACPLTATCTSINSCFNANTGSVTASTCGGALPFTYNWGGAAGNVASATGLAPGTYSVTITDAIGQTATTSCTVGQYPELTASASAGTILCNGGTTTVTVTAAGGTGPYSGTGSFTRGAGTFTFVVTDANGCSDDVVITIDQPTPVVAASSAGTILCNGGTTTVVVSATGGVGPYTGTGSFVRGAGTYTFNVTDANGCPASTSITITEPTQVVAASSAGTILCNGGTTTVVVSATGGVGPYTGTGSFVRGAGTYTFDVTDANGCPASTSITITEPTQVVAASSAGTILCNGGTTTVVVSATGGVGPYTGTGSFVRGAGTYTFDVTDANGCPASTSITITEPTQVVAASSAGTILCNGGTTTVVVSATGGVGPYTGTGSFVRGAGTYTFNVTDANGCPASTEITISQPVPLEISLTTNQRVSCNNDCNGVILSSVSGGTPSYSYLWSTGATSPNITNLCAGTYTLTVTDSNGCEAVSSEEELDNPAPILSASIVAEEDSNCEDDICDGSIVVTVTGGEPLYSYQWTEGTSGVSSGEISLNGICEGFYELLITDNRGCMDTVWAGFIGCRPGDCGPHKTFTQGGWGAVPSGNNPGVYLHANFDAAYPSGLTIGCGDNTLSFNSAQEITDFLPEGSTASALPNLTVLTGQLVAASLNVGFDAYDADFAGSDVALGDLFTDAEGFEGMTVSDILAAANEVIGGCSDAFDFASLNAVLTTINENFDNGTVDNGHLTCTAPAGTTRSMVVSNEFDNASTFMLSVYPNPAVDVANVQISTTRDDIFEIALYSMTGELVVKQQSNVTAGTSTMNLQVSELSPSTYLLRVNGTTYSKTQILVVR